MNREIRRVGYLSEEIWRACSERDKRRLAQLIATKKKIAKEASMSSAVGNPVSSVGIRSSHAPSATSVSTSTAIYGHKRDKRQNENRDDKTDYDKT